MVRAVSCAIQSNLDGERVTKEENVKVKIADFSDE